MVWTAKVFLALVSLHIRETLVTAPVSGPDAVQNWVSGVSVCVCVYGLVV